MPAPEAARLLDGPYAWLRLAISLTLAIVLGIGMWSLVLVLPEVQADFGVGRGDTSIAWTTTMLGFGVGNWLLGRLVDRFGVTPVLIGSGALMAAGFAFGARATGVPGLAAAQVLIGAGAAAGFGPLIADVSHWFRRRRGVAVAIAASGNYLAGVIWPLALRGLLEDEGWRAVYGLIAVICVLATAPLALALRRRMPLETMAASAVPRDGRAAPTGLSPRTLTLLLCVAGIGCCVAMAMPQVHIVAYCADLGYGVTVGAQMLALMLGAGVVSRLVSGFLADAIGGVRTLLIGSILQGVALALYLPFDGLVALYVVSFVFGLSQGGIVPSYAMIVREFLPPREAGARIGLVIMATIAGMALGGWLSGWIYDLHRLLPAGDPERHRLQHRQHPDHALHPLALGGAAQSPGGDGVKPGRVSRVQDRYKYMK